jgi:hypothetical protein
LRGLKDEKMKADEDRLNKQKFTQQTCDQFQILIKEKKDREYDLLNETRQLENKNSLYNDLKFLRSEQRNMFKNEIIK